METAFVAEENQLIALCDQISGAKWIAIDTEFMRETTYFPKLCLIQVATPDIAACIDPLALPTLEPLLDLLYDPDIIKVFHAGNQDLEIFFHIRGSAPQPIFDTQVAAPLLGHPEQAGYARLVESILGIRLDKAHTRTDWSHRPLSDAQVKYALDDVIHLCAVYEKLRDELTSRNRLQWLQKDFAELTNPERYSNPPEKAWRRVKSAAKLRGTSLRLLQDLARWREETAQSENRPRGRLFKDDVLTDIARQQPKNHAELSRVRGLHGAVLKRHGKAILDIITNTGTRAPEPLPEYQKKVRATPDQEALASLLNAVVHLRAAENDLNPTLLASAKELAKLISGNKDNVLMTGWRRELIGNELENILKGACSFRIVQGKLLVEPGL